MDGRMPRMRADQLLVERVAVDAQIEIVEPRGKRPAIARGDRDRWGRAMATEDDDGAEKDSDREDWEGMQL